MKKVAQSFYTLFPGLLLLLATVFSQQASAADLRGRLTGLPGASVIVNCGTYSNAAVLSRSGTFGLTGLPANKSCNFIVAYSNKYSTAIRFDTRRSLTNFNGKLKLFGQRIIVTKTTIKR